MKIFRKNDRIASFATIKNSIYQIDNKPLKSLTYYKHHSNGRNNQGKITIRHHGGSHKKLYRIIDFKRDKIKMIGIVKKITYDPNRNAKIALIFYSDGEKRYILYPQNLLLYSKITSGISTTLVIGNTLQLQDIPIGFYIHNIELYNNIGGQLVRAAGTSAKLLLKKKKYGIIRLPSKEIRLISITAKATIGVIASIPKQKNNKAGRMRWFGIRPTVRGVAMNACDHPHGGGEGRSPIGRKQPLTLWGKLANGPKTRKQHLIRNFYIIKRRK
uniref:Ribosomal protein L2 n=1 Tax=Pteridomonas sp. YPF1301 TaxID=2766739 RepID=A0A7G1MNL0_9STRA|nr:ribosomal protein L2 [Pteridomonas sp. YPF1301]